MHPLLKRQLKKIELGGENHPPSAEQWSALLERITASYNESDSGRELLERSLALSSKEMQELYENLRRTSESRLKNEQDRIQRIIDQAPDVVISMNAEGNILDWNPQAEAVFGWIKEEVQGKSLGETIIPPELRAAHQQGLAKFLLTGEGPVLNMRLEVNGLHRQGHSFPIELTITPIPWEGTYLFCAFIRDIRDRKAMEENLTRLSLFPQNNPNPVIQTDLESIVTYVNPAAEQQIPGLVVGSSDHPFLSSLPDLISFFLRGGDTNCIVEKGFAGSIFEVKVT